MLVVHEVANPVDVEVCPFVKNSRSASTRYFTGISS